MDAFGGRTPFTLMRLTSLIRVERRVGGRGLWKKGFTGIRKKSLNALLIFCNKKGSHIFFQVKIGSGGGGKNLEGFFLLSPFFLAWIVRKDDTEKHEE